MIIKFNAFAMCGFASLWIGSNSCQSFFMNYRNGQSLDIKGGRGLRVFAEVCVTMFLVFCGFLVGGQVLALLVLSSLMIADVLARNVGTALGLCIGIIFTLSINILEFMFLVPVLRMFWPTRTYFFTEATIEPFTARGTVLENLIELNLVGAFLLSVIPVGLAIAIKLRKTKFMSGFNPIVALICFLPLVLGAYRKHQDLLSYVVPTTSGDSRNFFLHVQRIRVTSDFTNLKNFFSQGDFSPSLASLISDGMGSSGILEFNDQYAVTALYVLFAVLIASSAIAITTALIARVEQPRLVETSPIVWSLFLFAGVASVQMPWVMNEMFRSGFFSAVAAMALCGVSVATVFARIPILQMGLIFSTVSILVFATYPIAAIYPLLGAIGIGLLFLRTRIKMGVVWSVVISLTLIICGALVVPVFLEQLRSRLELEGAIVYLQDSFWLPITIAGIAVAFLFSPIKQIGLVIATAGCCTAGFQFLARVLRESDGLEGYGYYGAKFSYVGLFIILLTLFSLIGSLIYSYELNQSQVLFKRPIFRRVSRISGAIGILIFASVASNYVLPESRGLYGRYSDWTQPTRQGLELARQYWNQPAVLFVRISDPGNDVLTNFWHPYYWSGEPWHWIYGGNGDAVETVCLFIEDKKILVVTRDAIYGESLRAECGAEVTVI
jgi:hypothetical protein